VVQRLIFLGIVALVGQGVVQREAGAPRLGAEFSVNGEVELLESLFLQLAAQADGVRRLFVNGQHNA